MFPLFINSLITAIFYPTWLGIGGFGQQLGGFASPSTGFGGAKFGAGVGSGLSGGLGLGGKTSPSSFGMSGGLGGVFTGGATQQAQPFGFAPAATNTFGAPQQQQVAFVGEILV